MRLSLAAPLSLGRGTNYGVEQRERKGVYQSAMEGSLAGMVGAMSSRRDPGAPLLTPEERWAAYRQVPDIRACVETVVRVISTYNWEVAPIDDLPPSAPVYRRVVEACADASRFLATPTTDGKSWQTLQSMLVRDLMVHDVYAAELPTTRRGRLEEVAPLSGASIFQDVDTKGRTVGYRQRLPALATETMFGPDEVLYLNLFPATAYPGGTPLIETLILEVGTVLHSARHLLQAYSADEIGSGLLVLAGLGKQPAERVVADLKSRRGKDGELRYIHGDNPNLDARWVEFKRSPKDLDMAALIKEVRRTIWRNFGCKPVTMGDSESTPRATAEVQLEAEDEGMIRPTLEMLQGAVNARVIPLLVGDPALASLIEFKFPFERDLTPQDRRHDAEADAVDFDRGVLTVNERRERRGYGPIDGGDVRLVRTGQGYVRLDTILDGEGDGTTDDTVTDTDAAPGEVVASRRAKYDHINFTPPKGVQDECQRGVDWVEDGEGGDGLKDETVRWARKLAAGDDITPDKARTMKAWLARHEVDKEAEGFRPGEEGYPSPGRVAWACWGGDPAVGWSKKLVEQMDAADADAKSRPVGRRSIRRFVEWSPTRAPCECGAEHHSRGSDLLPSDWQPGGRFKGYRTIDLGKLGESIIDYRTAVWPLYRRARLDIEAEFRALVTDDSIDPVVASKLLGNVRDDLDRLTEHWSAASLPLYRRAAKIGRDAAANWTKAPVVANWQSRADQYHDLAMGYLAAPDGLIG